MSITTDVPTDRPAASRAIAGATDTQPSTVCSGRAASRPPTGSSSERFFAAGFSPAQALEVVANVGLKTISNYIDGFAHVPLDAVLEPQRWMSNAVTAV